MKDKQSSYPIVSYIRTKELYKLFGRKIASRAWHAGWVRPIQRRHNFTIWSVEAVKQLQARLMRGEYPPRLKCELAYAAKRLKQRRRKAA